MESKDTHTLFFAFHPRESGSFHSANTLLSASPFYRQLCLPTDLPFLTTHFGGRGARHMVNQHSPEGQAEIGDFWKKLDLGPGVRQ